MFEHRSCQLLPRKAFIRRMRNSVLWSMGIIAFALAIGMAGYHILEGMNWVDSFANAAMILAGMGPLGDLHTDGGKIFAGLYALFCGIVFLGAIGILLAPIAHRALHKFHCDADSETNS
jgi:TRAP-type C4-dicarboxylate transport system permease small subunit